MRESPYDADARLATGGGSKIRLTRRFPQRGHIIRSRSPESGILRPRVHTRVSRFNSALEWQVALDRVLSTTPSRQRACTRQPDARASPMVSICIKHLNIRWRCQARSRLLAALSLPGWSPSERWPGVDLGGTAQAAQGASGQLIKRRGLMAAWADFLGTNQNRHS